MPIAPADGPPCPDCGAKMRAMLNQFLCDNECEKPEVKEKKRLNDLAEVYEQRDRLRRLYGAWGVPDSVWNLGGNTVWFYKANKE